MGLAAPEFDWDDANRDHLALHNVSPEEAQQAILDPHAVLLEIQSGDGEERTKALGITSGGRLYLSRGSHPAGHRVYRCSTPAGTVFETESDMIQKPIPQFKSEQEEAQWWDEHRDETAEWMEQAVAAGQTTTLSEVLERNRQGAGSTPTVSIRIDPEDIQRARSLAAKKGLRYQTYLKMLLHEALDHEERRVS